MGGEKSWIWTYAEWDVKLHLCAPVRGHTERFAAAAAGITDEAKISGVGCTGCPF